MFALLNTDKVTAIGPHPVYYSPQWPVSYRTHEPIRKLNTSINYVRPVLNCFWLAHFMVLYWLRVAIDISLLQLLIVAIKSSFSQLPG